MIGKPYLNIRWFPPENIEFAFHGIDEHQVPENLAKDFENFENINSIDFESFLEFTFLISSIS